MNQKSIPVIVLATSKQWQSAIEREFLASKLVWALDESDLLAEADRYPESALIVEWRHRSIETFHRWLPLVLEQSRRVFVVTGIRNSSAANLLRAAGVADVMVAISEAPRLSAMVNRHNQLTPDQGTTLEQQIQSALPWRR